MLNLKKIAITGGLSCGKSTVCRILKQLGAYVVSADDIAHQLLSPDTDSGKQVIKLLGADIVVHDQIDRSKVAKKVFNNPGLLQSLEQILHPAIRDEIDKEYKKASQKAETKLFVAEIPLLFESPYFKNYDLTVAVIAPEAAAKQRYFESTGRNAAEFDSRMARQLSPEEKAKRADYVISNNGSLDDLKNATADLFKQLTKPKGVVK